MSTTLKGPTVQDLPADGEGGAEARTPQSPDGIGSGTAQSALPPHERVRRKALLRFAVSITVLNIVGHLVLGFEQAPITPVLAVLVSYAASLAFETIDALAHDRTPEYAGGRTHLFYFLLPAHIAALACAMLLYADDIWQIWFAVVASAGSKYIFRVRSRGRLRHFLNPSNFGISLTLLTMPTVGFAPPYMFLNNTDEPFDWFIPVAVLTLGTMINAKLTKRMPLIAGWVAGYVLEAVARGVLLGDNVVASLGTMTGFAFVLYTNYMITDPGTTPFPARAQMIFGLAVGAVYGVLVAAGISYAIFFALIIVCFVRGGLLLAAELTHGGGPSHVR